jgi:hypothetical protein
MTVEQVAARYGIKLGYVYRLACLRRWQHRRDHDRRVRYRAADVHAVLEPGDRLLFYTDGVTEARNRSGQLFGSRRLRTTP